MTRFDLFFEALQLVKSTTA